MALDKETLKDLEPRGDDLRGGRDFKAVAATVACPSKDACPTTAVG
jgi:hypothetical protein